MIKDSTHGLKQKKFGTMAIVECEYELDTTTQAPGDKEREKIWETKTRGFRKDDASATSSTRTKAKKTAGMMNQAVEEETLSEEVEDEDEKGAAYTKTCIKHLMALGQGHIGVSVGLEDCDSVSGYVFMEAPVDQGSGDASERKVQGRGGTNPLKRNDVVKNK